MLDELGISNEQLKRIKAIPHNSKCRYGERGAADAGAVLKPSGGNCAVLLKNNVGGPRRTCAAQEILGLLLFEAE